MNRNRAFDRLLLFLTVILALATAGCISLGQQGNASPLLTMIGTVCGVLALFIVWYSQTPKKRTGIENAPSQLVTAIPTAFKAKQGTSGWSWFYWFWIGALSLNLSLTSLKLDRLQRDSENIQFKISMLEFENSKVWGLDFEIQRLRKQLGITPNSSSPPAQQ